MKTLRSHRSTHQVLANLALSVSLVGLIAPMAQAEGSRTLYPTNTNVYNRANLDWTDALSGNLIKRRTLLKVFANAGEHILVGSSAMGVVSSGTGTTGDIAIFDPGIVTGAVGSETVNIASASFLCSTQLGSGKITNRNTELAGPKAITGGGNPAGYTPCYYQAPVTGVYDVAMSGPYGFTTTNVAGGPTGEINLASGINFTASQNSTVAAWDVTVRNSNKNSTLDINGRLFAYYYAMFTGNNNRPINFSLYPVTIDGYRYKTTLQGLDPNGFVLYGNQAGFFDSDGKTPLYHDVIGSNDQLATLTGGVSLARPQFPIFLHDITPAPTVLSSVAVINTAGNVATTGIPLAPIAPEITAPRFVGNIAGNASLVASGGNFTFNSTAGVYEIIISRDGTNFDPTNPNNRALRGVFANGGSQSVPWNGMDNSGVAFPIGDNYPARLTMHGGEYHFPLLDAEFNLVGGPKIERLNGTNPLGNTQVFYDDRGYRTLSGNTVGTVNAVLCGNTPPNPAFSDPVTGIDSSIVGFRKYGGGGNGGGCPGATFGDRKGLDLWTFSPSSALNTPVRIVPPGPRLRLVKRMTAIYLRQPDLTYSATPLTGFYDVTSGTGAVDDNALSWPMTPAPYLQGIFDRSQVPPTVFLRPGDQVEYTIYFLSDAGMAAQGITLCDFVPQNSTYVPGSITKAFGSDAPTAVSDATGFYATAPTIAPASTACANGLNHGQGAVVVNIGTAPLAVGVGAPNDAYGFFRFRAEIK